MRSYREMGFRKRSGPTLIGQPVNPIRMALPADQRTSLSEWVMLPILAGLFGLGTVIVLVGWLLLSPDVGEVVPMRAELPRIVVTIPEPVTVERASEAVLTPPAEDEVFLRRMPSRQADETPPLLVPVTPLPSPKQLMPVSPRWVMEALPMVDPKLIMPIEVAKMEDAELTHTVRRVKLSDMTPTPMRLGVTKFVHDDLGTVLAQMGTGYGTSEVSNSDLLSLDQLKKYDVVFLTCSEMYVRDFRSAGTLRQFVEQGGTLYASDLRGDLLQVAFPEYRSAYPVFPGVPQNVDATVVDPALQRCLDRKQIPLKFESFDWRPSPFDPAKVTVCLRGNYRNSLGHDVLAPLLVKFRHKQGTVIFTSFHNSKVESPTVRKLIEYLVFSAVNARSENRLRDMMVHSGYSPNEMRPALLWPSKSVASVYNHSRGSLQVALGFEAVGAKVRLEIESPSGKKIAHADEGLFVVEIPNAEPGPWRITMTPIWLPFANFPVITSLSSGR